MVSGPELSGPYLQVFPVLEQGGGTFAIFLVIDFISKYLPFSESTSKQATSVPHSLPSLQV